jgi:predicted N-acetyltransferase YhbS
MQIAMTPQTRSRVAIRQAKPEDAEACGRICHDAFATINRTHNFPPDFDDPAHTTGLLSMMFSNPDCYCVVAEAEGRIIGSNCLYEAAVISGVGPITVDASTQNKGVGRALMQAVMERARSHHAAGVRLVQAAFHNRSLSLYTSLGFDVREPLACLQGRTHERSMAGCAVRKAESGDLEACNTVAQAVHGFDRGAELRAAINQGTAVVVERGGAITGYASSLAFFGHATTESNIDLMALIASAESFGGPGILVPSRNSQVFRWCLANGLRVVQPMTLMSVGLYNEPRGAFLPSVLF